MAFDIIIVHGVECSGVEENRQWEIPAEASEGDLVGGAGPGVWVTIIENVFIPFEFWR